MTKTLKIIIGTIALVLATAMVVTLGVLLGTRKKSGTVYSSTCAIGPSSFAKNEFIKYYDGTWTFAMNGSINFNIDENFTQLIDGTWEKDADGKERITNVTRVETKEIYSGIVERKNVNMDISDYKMEFLGSVIGEKFFVLGGMYHLIKNGLTAQEVVAQSGNIDVFEGKDYEYFLKTQVAALDKDALMNELNSMPIIFSMIYADGYIEEINKTQITSISDFDQTKNGTYDVTFTYLPDGEKDQTKTKTFTAKIYVAENEEDPDSDILSSDIDDVCYMAIGSQRKDFIKKVIDANITLEPNNSGVSEKVTEEMISEHWDSSKEGAFAMTLRYGKLFMDFDVKFFDPANLKVKSFDSDSNREIAKGTTEDVLKNSYTLFLNDGTFISNRNPQGYDLVYKIDGVAKTFAEITKTVGLKKITINVVKNEIVVCSTTRIIKVYDNDNKVVTNVEWDFVSTSKSDIEGFATKEDGSIDLSGSSLIVFFNNKHGNLANLQEGTDYIKINLTVDMMKNYRIVNGMIDWEKNSSILFEYTYEGILFYTILGY